ncbi:glycosyltransferase [Rhizobium sp. LjRoot254]|uniref:glycosyltransferase n=1 Tax=Rhizobium sp. LjRoot254 TaxID=3342297 RepID=UPI003ECEA4AB
MASRTIEIIYFDAGGGHRNAMHALSRLIEKRHPDWRIVPVDLQKLLEPIDPVHRLTRRVTGSLQRLLIPVAPKLNLSGWQAQDIYNTALKRGTTRGLGAILPILQGFVRRYSQEIEQLLVDRWRNPETARPDLVLSVIPNFNRVIFCALRAFASDIPYLTVMTDMVDYPPHFWMEDQDQFVICGTPKAAKQARATGFYAENRIFEVSGMILKDSFYQPPQSTGMTLRSLGLSEDRATALIMFGGNGSFAATQTILGQFEKSGLDIQTIVMCGNNKKLLESLKVRANCHPVGFVNNVADYLRLADFFIGKPGPGSLSEAIFTGCPVIIERNASTLPQERANVEWVRDNGLGIVVRSFRKDVAGAGERMLRDLSRYKANIAANVVENRAVFEIADIVEQIVSTPAARPVRLVSSLALEG